MKEPIHSKVFKRRTIILGAIKGALLCGLVGRLVNLQIFNRDFYQSLADKNRLSTRLLLPPRGNIIDTNGRILAFNRSLYSCIFNPIPGFKAEVILPKLQEILKLDPSEVRYILQHIKIANSMGIMIKENLTWEEMAILEINLPDLPGINIEKGLIRQYNHSLTICHNIGYVALASPSDIKNYKLPMIPGVRIGKAGIEKQWDHHLTGVPGNQQAEVNAKRKVVKIVSEIPPKSGQDLQLTLDIRLQKKVSEILSVTQSSIAGVLDLKTGGVLALVSHPGYDTNNFVSKIPKKEWNSLLKNPAQPLVNKTIAGQYAPGSTFKMIVALAALECNVVNPKTRFHCPGYMEYGNRRFHCWNWRYGGHGYVDMETAIARSCDIYFYNVSLMMGAEPICHMASKLGLGHLTGIEIPNEKAGLIPDKKWLDLYKKSGEKGQLLNLSIGQGVILTTPLQLLKMIGCLATGTLINPHIVKKFDCTIFKPLDILPDHLKIVQKGMAGVTKEGGTAFQARIFKPNFAMGGKTGTTQVSKITMKQREDGSYKDLPYHLRDHAVFVGYAPADEPRYAVCVLVEHGTSGGKVAAPIAKNILLAANAIHDNTTSTLLIETL